MNDEMLKTHVTEAIGRYPLLLWVDPEKVVRGVVEVRDPNTGEILEWYRVEITFPAEYPFCFPKVIELDEKIERKDFRHVNPDSTLCLAVKPDEDRLSLNGIKFNWFLEKVLLPRLADEYVVSNGGKYQHEFSHGDSGYLEYFAKEFQIEDKAIVKEFLRGMAEKDLPKGYLPCPCNSGKKFKKCHQKVTNEWNSLGFKRLMDYYHRVKNIEV